MAKKSLGYVELEWICPNCQNRNPGPQEKCATCGAPQPADVEFVQPLQEKIIEDKEKIADATSGPDIHCGYCGARNDANATHCRQCGADLKEGQARAPGGVLGAHRNQPVGAVKCPACGVENPADARRCRRCGAGLVPGKELEARTHETQPANTGKGTGRTFLLIAAGVVVLLIAFIFFATRTEETLGVVDGVTWQRTIEVEALVPVTKEDWLEEIPDGVELGRCQQKVARTQAEPAPGAVEVCGTPYTVDQGSGYGEVVQDCEYQILEDWCAYETEEWRSVDSAVASGPGLAAAWPELTLDANQRSGKRSEIYIITFEADGEVYRYQVREAEEAARFEEGSRWTL